MPAVAPPPPNTRRWLRVWPQVRRAHAYVNQHANACPWPRLWSAILESSDLPRGTVLPIAQGLDLAQGAPVRADFPDVTLLTPRIRCECGRHLTETNRKVVLGTADVQLLKRNSFRSAFNYALHCDFCAKAYFSYYTQGPREGNGVAQPWVYDDHGLGFPKAVLVNGSVAVAW